MAADEQTTWGQVCSNVGFSDNLYRTCRQKVENFRPAGFDAYEDEDEDEEDDEPFGKKIARSALPVPPPPPADWKDDSSFFEDVFGEDATKYMIVGGAAVAAGLVWWFFFRGQQVAVTETPQTVSNVTQLPGTKAA